MLTGVVNELFRGWVTGAMPTTTAYDQPCPNGGTTDKYTGWYLQMADGTQH